jgi:hypothetical protein
MFTDEEKVGVDYRTFVVRVVNELLGRDHVEELEHASFFKIVGCGACKHGHGVDAHFEAGGLSGADAGTLHFEVLVAEFHAVEAFYCNVCGCGVEVFAEGDALLFS